MFYGYIKDCNDISSKPKAFVRVSVNGPSTIKRDLLASAKSSFSVLSIPSNINNGDIFTIYDSKGKEWYTGKITSYGDGKISCTQKQSILSGLWIYQNAPTTTIEGELKTITEGLISGKVGDLTDSLIANKYKDFTVTVGSATEGHLPTYEYGKTVDFEKFIYQMYEDYGIIFDITIPYEGSCNINIFKPDYSSQLISDNTNAISGITPTLEIEQYNKLIIFSKAGDSAPTYRATYVVSADSVPIIYKLDDSEVLNRFVETNTKVVFSDDELDTIVASNLTTEMYNHELTLSMLLDNKLYDWRSIKLGQPLEVWNGTDYYKTIYTGNSMSIPANSDPNTISMVCGKVRTALTTKLLRTGVY